MTPTRVPPARTSVPRRAPIVPEALPAATPDRVAPARDRERVDRTLRVFLAQSRLRYAANPHARPIFDRAAEFVLGGGKRIRPRLALASYRILAGTASGLPRSARRAATSLELFHAFMLAHDDLIDGSLSRRGRPTLHEAIRHGSDINGACDGRKRAADLGLIAGDLLCALGMRLLGRAGLDDATLGRAHRLVSDMLVETGVGEALDVLYEDCPLGSISESQILDAYLRKTSRYTVSGPLAIGATLAGAESATTRALRRFGDSLGLAFQVQNDLDGLPGADESDECPDLDTGKRTWILWAAHHRLDGAGRSAIDAALELPVGTPRRRVLFGLIEASGAIDEAHERIASMGREAVSALRDSRLAPEQRASFLGLLDLLGPRTAIAGGIAPEPEDGPISPVVAEGRA